MHEHSTTGKRSHTRTREADFLINEAREPRCLISKMALPKDFIGTIEDDDEVAVVSEDTSSDEEVKVSYYDIL